AESRPVRFNGGGWGRPAADPTRPPAPSAGPVVVRRRLRLVERGAPLLRLRRVLGLPAAPEQLVEPRGHLSCSSLTSRRTRGARSPGSTTPDPAARRR